MKANLQKIEHVVVLMLENRSFDNMFGWLGASDGGRQKVNGVAGKKLSNPIPPYADRPKGVRHVPVGIEMTMTNPNPDPGEEYAHVNTQLFGKVIPEANRYKPFDTPPYNLPKRKSYTDAPMNGFVTDYINNFNAIRGKPPRYDQYKIIMDCHPEEAVPVLSALAKEYAVFDAWFSPAPTQTLPNRAFMHSATSNGWVLNKSFYHWLLDPSPTIFDRLEDKGDSSVTWAVYYDQLDFVSLTGLTNPTLWKDRNSNFKYMEDFINDARAGSLPSYAFIEPRLFVNHNDQHPPVNPQILETSSVTAGEILIADVYRAIRASPKWNNTVLIITYDEHGGCYDHVPPPAALPPHPNKPIGEQGFQFDRYGVRVPAVMISPYIKKGTIISETHDHTSILKMICTRWGLKHLTERDRTANDISKALNLKSPRDDTPTLSPRPYVISPTARAQPLNDLQKVVLFLIVGFEDIFKIKRDEHIHRKVEDFIQLVLDGEQLAHLKTVGQAIDFTMDFDSRTSKRVPFWAWLWRKIKRMLE